MNKDNINNAPQKEEKKKKKALLIILIILAVLLVLAAAFTISNLIGKNAAHDYDDMTINVDGIRDFDAIDENGKTIEYKGETYNFNEAVAGVVLLGIDAEDSEEDDKNHGEGGYADAIYIAVVDTEKNKVSVLNVNRNSMVDVDTYDKDGTYVDTQNMQICLAYEYLDGKKESVENTIVSLERLFNGLKFNTYFAMDQRDLVELNDYIGGVTLVPSVDFYSVNKQAYIPAGEEFTLLGQDAIMYIRSREWDQSAIEPESNRISRQQQYMTEFLSQTWDSVKKDPTNIPDMYNIIVKNSTTNVDTNKFNYFATDILTNLESYLDIDSYTLSGEFKKSESDYYDEYYVDQDKLMELMVKLFYTKAE